MAPSGLGKGADSVRCFLAAYPKSVFRRAVPFSRKSAIVDVVAHLSIELIERYALRELSEVEIQLVEKHVLRCSECRDRLQGEVGVAAAVRSSTAAQIRKIVKAEKRRPK
jgi:lipopolysaccharide biosynthesis protein